MRLFHHGEDNAAVPVDASIAPFQFGTFDHAGDLLQEHAAFGRSNDGDFSQVIQDAAGSGSEAAENANGAFGFARDCEAATRIDVAFPQRFFNVLYRHVILEQGRRIEQDLVLLAIAALHEHFGNAGHLQQPRPNHPVGDRAQFEKLFGFRLKSHFVYLVSELNGGDKIDRGIFGDGSHAGELKINGLPLLDLMPCSRLPDVDFWSLAGTRQFGNQVRSFDWRQLPTLRSGLAVDARYDDL